MGIPDGATLALVENSSNDDDHPDLTIVVPMRVIEEAISGNQRPLMSLYRDHKAGISPKPKVSDTAKERAEAVERDILTVFEYHTEHVWGRKKHGKRPSLRPAQHRRLHRQLTKEGYGAADLCLAIDGALTSEWHCGKNPGGVEYLAIENIFPYDGRVQGFIDRARSTSNDRHANVRNVQENRESVHLQLRELAAKMRSGTASIEDKGKFSRLGDELRQWGETYSWQTDVFSKKGR